MYYEYYLTEATGTEANNEAKKIFKDLQNKFRGDVKDIKDMMKNKQYDLASKKCNDLNDYIDEVIKNLKEIYKSIDNKGKEAAVNTIKNTLKTMAISFISLFGVLSVSTLIINKHHDLEDVKDNLKFSGRLSGELGVEVAAISGVGNYVSVKSKLINGYIGELLIYCKTFKKQIINLSNKIKTLDMDMNTFKQ